LICKAYQERGWKHAYVHYRDLVREQLAGTNCILDIGCGVDFPDLALLESRGAEVHGIDPIAENLELPHGHHLHRGVAEALPFDNERFDLVVTRCALEHLRRPVEAFREIHRVLGTGGRFVFLTPSKYDYVSIIAALVPNGLHPTIIGITEGRDHDDVFPTFYRANSVGDVKRLASLANLSIVRCEYLNHCPYLLSFSPLLCRLAIAYDRWISRHPRFSPLKAWLMGLLEIRKGSGNN
jgi:SAM-dependent methyltransferase